VVDDISLPVGVRIESASPHDVKLVESTLDAVATGGVPERLIGDKAYDSDALNPRLELERGIEPIVPNQRHRKKSQAGRPLRMNRPRWRDERFFAWLKNFGAWSPAGNTMRKTSSDSCNSDVSSSCCGIHEMASILKLLFVGVLPPDPVVLWQ
jgi:hypothetical protein